MRRTLFLGVGNTLLMDEGAGIHAMRFLESDAAWPDEYEFLDAGTLSFTLADAIACADNLVIFDAADFGEPPGHVRALEGDDLDEFLVSGKRSVHEVGFADLMDISRLQGCLPGNRALIGIQPGDFGWSDEPGEAVKAALPLAAELARDMLDKWSQIKPTDGGMQ